MLKTLRNKLSNCWHILRGHPLMYRAKFSAEVVLDPNTSNLWIIECTFINPEPPSHLDFTLPPCGFFLIERSSCLRPVAALVQSLERGSLWVCQKHLQEQEERDRLLCRTTLSEVHTLVVEVDYS